MTVLPDSVEIDLGPLRLKGLLGVPPDAAGLVIFAHGSGSSRLSARNNRVAAALRDGGLATLLLDLLTAAEENDRANVFDIPLLASRLSYATDWAIAASESYPSWVGRSRALGTRSANTTLCSSFSRFALWRTSAT